MSATRVTRQRDEEPGRITVRSTLPPMLAREVASRRDARRAEGPRHLPPTAPGPARGGPGAAAVAVAGVLLAVGAVAAAVLVLWPRASGESARLETGAVTTTTGALPGGRAAGTGDTPATRPASPEPSAGSTGSGGSTGSTDSTGSTAADAGSAAGPTADTSASAGGTGAGGGADTGGGRAPTTASPPGPGSTSPPASAAPPDPADAAGRSSAPGGGAATTTTAAPSPTPAPASGPSRPNRGDPGEDATWDELARCESRGDWSADTGNGRYGGLQIRAETWRRYGGNGFPHQRPRDTQIEVARRIQADQGWGHWPTCARQLGYL